jgi:hypothetical protein
MTQPRFIVPGRTVLPQELGRRTWRIERPEVYFDANNPQWPDTVELSLRMGDRAG